MADFGIIPDVYEVDQAGDWSDYAELIIDEALETPDDLTDCSATATLVNIAHPTISVVLSAVITQPNLVRWTATQEHLAAAPAGNYRLKVKVVRADGFRQVVLRGEVVLIP